MCIVLILLNDDCCSYRLYKISTLKVFQMNGWMDVPRPMTVCNNLDIIQYLPPHGASLKTTAFFWFLYLGKTWQPLKKEIMS